MSVKKNIKKEISSKVQQTEQTNQVKERLSTTRARLERILNKIKDQTTQQNEKAANA